ncbi:hypothetical protein DV495_003188 [Geotrichum candidum]|nr:hypothetical protein DV495_003188 [Geotrichum candidum]
MSHVSLPRLGHLAVDNNYGSPTSLSPVETSGTDEDDTSGNSTPDQNALETSGEAVVVSVATTPQKAGSAVVELTPIQGPLESTVKTDNDAVLVSVKRKHLAGKPHFQEFFGFYTLFWLSVGLFMTRTLIDNYRAGTSVLDFEIVRILRRDLFKVALTDLGMYLAGYFCVALQWAIRAKLIRWRSSGWIIQNVSIISLQNNNTASC